MQARATAEASPRRLVAIHVPLGMMPQFFFPASDEAEPTSPYLDLLAAHRGAFTVFSGLSHPDVGGNHHAGQCFLTGAPHAGQPTFRNSLSLDQFAAERIGLETRFPFLSLAVAKGTAAYENLKPGTYFIASGPSIPMASPPGSRPFCPSRSTYRGTSTATYGP